MRVLQYIGSLAQGGSQSMIMNIYRNLDRDAIQFDFVIHADGITPLANEAINLGAKIYRCPRYSIKTAHAYSKWWNTFFEEHPEYKVVHSHVRSTASIVLSIAKRHGCVTIAHSHSTSSGNGIEATVKSLLQFQLRYVADYFMGCSRAAGEWLFGEKICKSERYYDFRNAINADQFEYNAEIATKHRTAFDVQEGQFLLGTVGRITKPKNPLRTIEIISALKESGFPFKFIWVGTGELENSARERIAEYQLDDVVIMTGTRQDVNELLMAMDLFLFPSLWEGLPVSVIEAQAAGLPCVISDTITKEVCVTSLVNQLSLDEPNEVWVKAITDALPSEKVNTKKEIEQAGYDIKASVKWISDFYTRIEKESCL